VIYPDGSCLACEIPQYGSPGEVAFTSDPTIMTAVEPFPQGESPEALVEFGVDGLPRKVLLSGALSDPVWSSHGELAVVKGGWIWLGHPGKLRRLTPGSAPSWSPDGTQIVFDRRGWLLIVRVHGRSLRRLVRGTAPAWSPEGRRIAFFGKGHRLSVVRANGGRVRHVGKMTGRTVDWQPLPAKPPASCLTPPEYTVAASSNTAILSVAKLAEPSSPQISGVGSLEAMGCLRADGRERMLASLEGGVEEAEVAGTYAALAIHFTYGGYNQPEVHASEVKLFDLQTAQSALGGETVDCLSTGTCGIDHLVLGSDAVSAVHTIVEGFDANGAVCSCTVEKIQASDSTGRNNMLDSVTEPEGSPTALTNLTLTRDTLTWEHDGSPRSAQLQP
jgi:hypothetical protein